MNVAASSDLNIRLKNENIAVFIDKFVFNGIISVAVQEARTQ